MRTRRRDVRDRRDDPQKASPPAPEDPTTRYASLLASGEQVLLVRRRHWLTFLEAGRWFLLAVLAAILSGALDSEVGNGGVSGVLSTVLGRATGAFLLIGVLGVGWYVIVWRVERYIVTTRRVIETGGVINKWSRDTSLEMITDMIVDHPLLGRIFGYGEIDLLTASEQGENKIRFLPDPDGFKKALLDAKQKHALELADGDGARGAGTHLRGGRGRLAHPPRRHARPRADHAGRVRREEEAASRPDLAGGRAITHGDPTGHDDRAVDPERQRL